MKPTFKTATYGIHSIKYNSDDNLNKFKKKKKKSRSWFHNGYFLLEKIHWIFENINLRFLYLEKCHSSSANKQAIEIGCTSLIKRFLVSNNNLKFAIYIFINITFL